MKTARVLLAGAALTLVIAAQSATAEEGWLDKLNPFAKKESHKTIPVKHRSVKKAEPSPLEKFNTGTKKFFAGARDALTWKKTAPPKKKPTNQYVPWTRQSKDAGYLTTQKKKKKSWFDSLFRREEPKRVESMKDFVGLPRPNP